LSLCSDHHQKGGCSSEPILVQAFGHEDLHSLYRHWLEIRVH
jgi:hypothetical protein